MNLAVVASRRLRAAIVLLALAALAGCADVPRGTSGLPSLPHASPNAPPPLDAPATTVPQTPAELQPWREQAAKPPPSTTAAQTTVRLPAPPITVNVTLDRAPIAAAAEAVLGDTLQRSYRVDPGVTGDVSVKLIGDMTEADILTTFDQALRASGAALIDSPGGGIAVVAAKDAPIFTLAPDDQATPSAEMVGGLAIYGARNIGAEQIVKLLTPMAQGHADVHADESEEHVFISGDPATVNALARAAALFDVDWLRGRNFEFYPLRYASAAAVSDDVEKVLGGHDGPVGSQVELITIDRLNAIIVAAKSSDLLDQTVHWIQRMDQPASPSEERLRVVHLDNLVATDFVKTISDLFARAPAPGAIVGPNRPGSMATVTADPRSNSVIMYADDAEYQSLLGIVRELDVTPPQVLIEATVAEVQLNDRLQFGVQWYLQSLPSVSGGFLSGTGGPLAGANPIAPTFPGLNLTYMGTNIQVALNALSTVTEVQLLATPRMLVLANDTATLQVGSSVPIITSSSSGIQADSLVVNSVEYRDTGVVLTVTPRVGAGGEIYIDVQQEVSDVSSTTSSDIDSPTIDQRKFHTQIAVQNGQVIAIGGLIQTNRTKSQSGVPGISRIPILGAAFRQRQDTKSRDELVVFLKPTLVRSRSEADAITDELAAGLRALGYGRR
ncbi:MAG TPA: type II secretion system secretin GspD [Caulobacteraceae bacterium]|nr:type II secretion system secretin GspD [Caulobacteraceae bacterium]